ncbi:MAG: hypothetical protein ACFCGT_25380 [Sandaracinaceae bacterium]
MTNRASIRRPLRVTCAAAVGMAVAACGGGPSTGTDDAREANADTRGLAVRLLAPGATPRRALRYRHDEGHVENVLVRLAIQEIAESGGQAQMGGTPPISLLVRLGPTRLDGSLVEIPVVIDMAQAAVPAEVDPEAAAAIQRQVEPLSRVRGVLVTDRLGRTRGTRVPLPPDVSFETAQMLGDIRATLMTVPLPEEQVGVGARWETTRETQAGPIRHITQTVVYTVSEMTSDGPVLQVTFRGSAPQQPLTDPTREADVDVTLDAYESTGVGSARVDLHALTAFSELDFSNMSRATLARGGVSQPARSERRMRVEVSPDL